MRSIHSNLILIVASVIFFTVYFTNFLDSQRPISKAHEFDKTRKLLNQNSADDADIDGHHIKRQKTAKLRRDIFFLKTHKCASSTVQNILMRFGFNNGLDFVLPARGNYLGNPKHFRESMIGKSVRTVTGKYNIFTHHTRFNKTATKNVMRKGALYVTVLRRPAELYESVYNYYNLEKRYQMNLTSLINNYSMLEGVERDKTRFGFNQMCFDLGMDEKNCQSRRKINRLISEMDKTFDLIMMAEYMEESLILMADLLKWPMESIVFLKLNSRISNRKTKLDSQQRRVLRGLNKCDTRIQDYYLHKFKQRIKEYGAEKMQRKVQELVQLNDQFYNRCIESKQMTNTSQTVKYEIKKGSNFDCSLVVMSELPFTAMLRNTQHRRAIKLRSLKKLLKD